MSDVRDFTVIGGGPTGLYAAFYAAMRGLSVRIVDSLPELGGQLMALYPEKHIYDVGGFRKVLAKDLATGLIEQAMQFQPDVLLDEEVHSLERDGDVWVLGCRGGEYRSRAVLIAGGKGAFEPRSLEVPGYHELLHRGVHYAVKDPETYRGKRVAIVGGGDSALDWALILKDVCTEVALVHRREGFRAHEASVAQMERACDDGQIRLLTYHEVREIHGNGTVDGVTVFDNRTDEDLRLEVDSVLTFLGFKPDLGPIKEWGLELADGGRRIVVDQLMRTNLEGVWAAGDLVDYDGKLDLIATGFAEGAIAANQATRYVNPDARVNPGHSTSNKAFK
ncbi:MAG TPA: NAD(P)/FAD-dependent oxidoreductase [Longimicrobiales bacterium]|nr:NAD(P)/FAD-dependent oxidoreductase [Longimicrobiales bacterium]